MTWNQLFLWSVCSMIMPIFHQKTAWTIALAWNQKMFFPKHFFLAYELCQFLNLVMFPELNKLQFSIEVLPCYLWCKHIWFHYLFLENIFCVCSIEIVDQIEKRCIEEQFVSCWKKNILITETPVLWYAEAKLEPIYLQWCMFSCHQNFSWNPKTLFFPHWTWLLWAESEFEFCLQIIKSIVWQNYSDHSCFCRSAKHYIFYASTAGVSNWRPIGRMRHMPIPAPWRGKTLWNVTW